MKHIVALGLCILCLTELGAQTPMIDSLGKELGKDKDDSIKVHDRIRISWYLIQQKDSANAWKNIVEADSIADKTGNPVLKGIVYEHMGFLHNRMFSKEAITYYLQAENILKNYPNSPTGKKSMASLCLNIGIEHMNVNDEEGALAYYFEGIKRYEALDTLHSNLSVLYANIINSYYNLGKYEMALTYCEKAYRKSIAAKFPAAIMSATINYARVLMKLNEPERAQYYFERCKQIADSVNDLYFQSNYFQIKGNFKYDAGDFQGALTDFTKGFQLIKLTEAPYDIASCLIWMGACNTALNRLAEGRKYLDSAYLITKQYDYTHQLKQVYYNRYLLEKKQGNLSAAMLDLESFYVIQDSLQKIQDGDRIEFLDAKYQADKKEAEISKLVSDKEIQRLNIQRKSTINYILALSALLILVISYLITRNIRQKQKIQQQRISELETQQQLTATEAVLKGEEQERTRLAKDLHDGLGGILSGIKYSFNAMKGNLVMTPENNEAFERSMEMLDTSIKEMRRVAHNMMPEALVKFGLDVALKDFCTGINESGVLQVKYQSIGMDGVTLDQTTAVAIYRIVQELINNSIKHASAKMAIVQLSKANDVISITVEDDGRGFSPVILEGTKGIGWSNIQSRVDYLKGRIDVRSKPGEGTSVQIELNA